MQSSTDRRRLMRMYCDDPTAHSWFLVGRCSAGLAIVALIAVFGLGALHTTPASSQAASVKASRGAVARISAKTAGNRRQNTESGRNPLVAAEMEVSKSAERVREGNE